MALKLVESLAIDLSHLAGLPFPLFLKNKSRTIIRHLIQTLILKRVPRTMKKL